MHADRWNTEATVHHHPRQDTPARAGFPAPPQRAGWTPPGDGLPDGATWLRGPRQTDGLGDAEDGAVLRLRAVGIADGQLDFDLQPGEIVHLHGGTPLCRLRVLALAAGLHAGASGEVELLGQPLAALDDHQRRDLRERAVGRVLSTDHLPAARRVLDAVAAPLQRLGLAHAEAQAQRALDTVGLGGRAQWPTAALNPVQQRQALLARAIAPQPRLLVLESPETGLDGATLIGLRPLLWTLTATAQTAVLFSSAMLRLRAAADRAVDLDRLA